MNPLYNTNDSPNGSTQPTKAVNRQGVNVSRSYNQFDLSYHNFKTQHFGLYEPFFVQHCVEKDKLPLNSQHSIRTLPMQSPVMSPLQISKDFFMVPYQAILPKTWELIYRNPSQGSDVPEDANSAILPASKLYSFLDNLETFISSADPQGDTFSQLSQYFLCSELFFSTGSLLYNLGFKVNPLVSCPAVDAGKTRISFDTYFDLVFGYIFDQFRDNKKVIRMQIGGTFGSNIYILDEANTISSADLPFNGFKVSRSQVLDLMREKWFDIAFLVDPFVPNLSAYVPTFYKENLDVDSEGKPLPFNYDSVLAYQVICSQYYVNPQVDFIYNCEIFRENFNSLFIDAFGTKPWYNTEFLYFDYNGNRLSYDYFSGHYVSKILDASSFYWGTSSSANSNYPYALLSYLFGYRNSLRFGDYFIDSRTRPYAVGTMDANVVDNKVSAIDITKNITMQRYLNAVIKLGNNFGDYLRGIFGTTPAPDYHFPKFISSFKSDVSGFETASTVGAQDAAQGTVVSQLKSDQDVYAYDIEIDMPCIVMGISYFVMPRVYCRTRDRFFFHRDRFDMFNPFLQYIGDQPILGAEKGALYNYQASPNFGYQSRYAEYKQRYSVASGGFVEGLPSWAFVVDTPVQPALVLDSDLVQSPDFIRCRTYEFDRFFGSLSGLSLGHRWHFIMHYYNQVKALRAMEVNPNIL